MNQLTKEQIDGPKNFWKTQRTTVLKATTSTKKRNRKSVETQLKKSIWKQKSIVTVV